MVILLILQLQDNVLLPEGVTEYIYLVGKKRNAFNNYKWIDPGRKKSQRGRKSVFFTLVSPMDDDKGMEETPCDLTMPRIAPYKNTWRPYQNTVYWYNLMLVQKRGLQFYQTRSHAIVPYNTLPVICIEKAVRMKTKEEGYLKVCLTPRLPRAVLKPNSRSSQQDQQEQDARSSCVHPCGSKGSGETWCNNVDNRIPGIPHSAVEQQDTNRRDTVKKLIQHFESHPNKESILQDFKQTEKIIKFKEKSQELIGDINNTEIFELCETSSKKQCFHYNVYWEIGLVHGTCGRCLKPSQRTKEFDKNNYDVLSIPGYVIKKNNTRRCQTWTFRAAANVLQGYGNVAKSSSTQAWRTQIHT